jgi:hypothetical protein
MYAAFGFLFVGVVLGRAIIVWKVWGDVAAHRRAEARLSPAEKEIRDGNKDLYLIPDSAPGLEKKFAPGELICLAEVDGDLREIPAYMRDEEFLNYDIVEAVTGKVIWRGPYGPKSPYLDLGSGRNGFIVRVSRHPGSRPVYLKVNRRWRQSSFGYYGGPNGTEGPPK